MEDHGIEEHGGGMRHDFSDAEHWAKRFDSEDRAAWQKPGHVVGLLGLGPGDAVADIGAGTGYFLPWLHAVVGPEGKVLGLDVEQSMVEWMTARAESEGLSSVEARRIGYDGPGLAAGEVDRILVVDTWHHIGNRVEYVGKICKALAENGALYIVDFTLDAPEGPPLKHRLKAEQVIAELEAGGLEARVVEEELPRQWIVEGRRPAVCPGEG